jgi:hypothetical protein
MGRHGGRCAQCLWMRRVACRDQDCRGDQRIKMGDKEQGVPLSAAPVGWRGSHVSEVLREWAGSVLCVGVGGWLGVGVSDSGGE